MAQLARHVDRRTNLDGLNVAVRIFPRHTKPLDIFVYCHHLSLCHLPVRRFIGRAELNCKPHKQPDQQSGEHHTETPHKHIENDRGPPVDSPPCMSLAAKRSRQDVTPPKTSVNTQRNNLKSLAW